MTNNDVSLKIAGVNEPTPALVLLVDVKTDLDQVNLWRVPAHCFDTVTRENRGVMSMGQWDKGNFNWIKPVGSDIGRRFKLSNGEISEA